MAGEALPVGQHALIDIYGADRLDDPAFLEKVMRDAADAAGATVIGARLHHFDEGNGVTGVLLLAESHISVHTWPEHAFAAFDVFMCGSARISQAISIIVDCFPAAEIETKIIKRGVAGG